MKYRNLLPWILLFGLMCLASLNAQTKTSRKDRQEYKKTNKVEFDLCYDISVPGKTSKIGLTVILPQTLPQRQKVYRIEYSHKPKEIVSVGESKYARFEFIKPPKQFQLKINVRMALYRYDLSIARKKKKIRPPYDLDPNDFLKQVMYIEKDHPVIKEIARKLKGDTQAGLVKNIHDYIITNIEYYNDNKRSGAVYTAQQKEGQCCDYADLFIALCRAKGIPARYISGYTMEPGLTQNHAWPEVYFKRYGWVPFDPTWADIKHKSADQFHYLKSVYVYVVRNDKYAVLKSKYNWRHWGDKIEVEDTIEFK